MIKEKNTTNTGPQATYAIIAALLAAFLFGLGTPLAKILLDEVPPTLMAALLYLGAGVGMAVLYTVKRLGKGKSGGAKISKKDRPYLLAMLALDIIAPTCLMIGLSRTSAATASLINNFEVVVTALIALCFFREAIGKRMWIAIALITSATILLSVGELSGLRFSFGSLFVVAACISWGLENNCTRMLAHCDPMQIVVINGLGSGGGMLILALALGQRSVAPQYILLGLLVGFVAYGLSIYFYIRAQRDLGAARTSAYYAITPFVGVLLSCLILRERPALSFFIALAIMLLGGYLTISERRGEALRRPH